MTGWPDVSAVLAVVTAVVLGAAVVVGAGSVGPVARATTPLLLVFGFHVVWSLLTYAELGFVVPDEELYHRLALLASDDFAQGRLPDVRFTESKAGWVYVLRGPLRPVGRAPADRARLQRHAHGSGPGRGGVGHPRARLDTSHPPGASRGMLGPAVADVGLPAFA